MENLKYVISPWEIYFRYKYFHTWLFVRRRTPTAIIITPKDIRISREVIFTLVLFSILCVPLNPSLEGFQIFLLTQNSQCLPHHHRFVEIVHRWEFFTLWHPKCYWGVNPCGAWRSGVGEGHLGLPGVGGNCWVFLLLISSCLEPIWLSPSDIPNWWGTRSLHHLDSSTHHLDRVSIYSDHLSWGHSLEKVSALIIGH